MKLHRLVAGAAVALLATAALAQTQPVPGAVQANGMAAPVQATAIIVAPSGGGPGRGVVVAPDRPLPVTCISGCSGGGGGGGTTTTTATAAAPSLVEGSTTNQLSVNLTADLRTIAKQSGTWDIGTLSTLTSITNAIGIKGVNGTTIATNANPIPVSVIGTVSIGGTVGVAGSVAVTGPLTDTQLRATALPLPAGASTAALQSAPQGIFGAVTANRGVIYDSTGTAVDWAAPVPVTDNGGSLTVDGTVAATQSGAWAVAGSGVFQVGGGTTPTSVAAPTNALPTVLYSSATGGNVVQVGGSNTDALATTSALTLFNVNSWGRLYNGATGDRARSIVGGDGTGTGVTAIATAPCSIAACALAPNVSAALTGSTVFKASAGNLYSVSVTSGASAGFLLVFNATAAPADGAVTPQICIPVAANSLVPWDATTGGIPERFTTGIVGVFSTTGCYIKTISATAFLHAKFQ